MISQLVQRMLKGDRRALARLLSLLEQDPKSLPQVMKAVHPHIGRAYCVGVTGPPGAGKSTIVDGIVQVLRDGDTSVGVLAVDPTSPFTGGAVLGDRIRMQRHSLDEGVFIRSLATRGTHGGLPRAVGAAVKLLDAYGREVVIVETVGVGQTELDIMGVADTVVVVLTPESGDAVQAMKAGLTEIGDLFVVNKADRDGSGRLVVALRSALAMGAAHAFWRPPVLKAEAHRGKGIQALYDAIIKHRRTMEKGSLLDERRRERRRQELVHALTDTVQDAVAGLLADRDALKDLETRVVDGDMDPYSAAAQALDDGTFLSRLAELAGRRGGSAKS
ncbi:MAG: methylmalonyl Co-A mutase-associated GTPase MeaB [Chloroflexi bacterium]|nr:methylmalonyl Co-A mutase-associated GTPase MeaB [Chloroflexota bacterium]